jgi:hypothetical protein
MRIFQVKYNTEKYVYYMAEDRNLITTSTKFYRSYVDCQNGEINHLDTFEQDKLYKSLVKFFANAEN